MSKDIEGFSISIKSMLSASAILFLLIGEYVVLHQEIEVAKQLPKAEITRVELEYIKKDIELLEKALEELKDEL